MLRAQLKDKTFCYVEADEKKNLILRKPAWLATKESTEKKKKRRLNNNNTKSKSNVMVKKKVIQKMLLYIKSENDLTHKRPYGFCCSCLIFSCVLRNTIIPMYKTYIWMDY